MAELLDSHEAVLLDAYGVLVDGFGVLDGARELLKALSERAIPHLVVTNDASRLPSTMAKRFADLGLPIPESRIVSSGGLIAPHMAALGLASARCVVLGPEDSKQMVRSGGGEVVPPVANAEVDAVFICDEAGYPFVETLDNLISQLFSVIERGKVPRLILPNPDLLYPKRSGEFGIAAGSIAALVESALLHRFPNEPTLRFERLGKPYAPIFEHALRVVGTRNTVMVGDQLVTDIKGANDVGITSALVTSGLTRIVDVERGPIAPTYVLAGIHPG